MGTYLFEDFTEVYGGIWQALNAFLSDWPSLRSGLVEEIGSLLEQHGECEIRELLISMGSNVYLDEGSESYREWLQEISVQVQQSLGRR